ncbi:MAG: hypothetical protein ABJG15_01845 [Hyphomonadaceae bacterium]
MRFAMRALQIISYFCAGVGVIVIVLVLAFQGDVVIASPVSDGDLISVKTTGWEGDSNFWTNVAAAVYGFFFVSILYRLGGLMGLFLKRHYFTQKAVGHMRYIAWIYLLLNLIGFTSAKWQGYGHDGLNTFTKLSGDGIFGLILSLTFLIVAHILNEARKNMDELENYF